MLRMPRISLFWANGFSSSFLFLLEASIHRLCQRIPPTMYVSIHVRICLSIYLSIYLPIYLCIYLSIYLSMYLSIHSSIHPSVHPSIYTQNVLLEAVPNTAAVLNMLPWEDNTSQLRTSSSWKAQEGLRGGPRAEPAPVLPPLRRSRGRRTKKLFFEKRIP